MLCVRVNLTLMTRAFKQIKFNCLRWGRIESGAVREFKEGCGDWTSAHISFWASAPRSPHIHNTQTHFYTLTPNRSIIKTKRERLWRAPVKEDHNTYDVLFTKQGRKLFSNCLPWNAPCVFRLRARSRVLRVILWSSPGCMYARDECSATRRRCYHYYYTWRVA